MFTAVRTHYMSVFITGVWNLFPKMYGKQLAIQMQISSCLIQLGS